ncbi:MAG: hypothetical protein ACJAUP_003452 [Cellvibrionaceae bacterium]
MEAGEVLSLKKALEIMPISVQYFGKLLLWCFLAGYSERLVPNILVNLKKEVLEEEAAIMPVNNLLIYKVCRLNYYRCFKCCNSIRGGVQKK